MSASFLDTIGDLGTEFGVSSVGIIEEYLTKLNKMIIDEIN